GKAEPLLQVAQQIEDLRADRDIERGDRFVADDQLRLDRKRARNRDALALAAGKFVGVAAGKARLQPDQPQQFLDPCAAPIGRHQIMQRQRLAEDLSDRHARVEGSIGILEDDLRLPAKRAQRIRVEVEQIAAFEPNAARVRFDQAQHEAADGGLAAAGFADESQRLAGIDVEADAVDRSDESGRPAEQIARRREMLDQVFGFEKRGHDTSLSKGALMQREVWPGFTSTSGGGALRQASATNGQRAAKRQADGGLVMFGTMPSMVARCSARWSSLGIEPSRPTV